MIRSGDINKEPIRPVVYGVMLYFLLAGTDCFSVGSFGSFLKIIALLPMGLAFLEMRKLKIRFSAGMVLQLLFWFIAAVSLFYSIKIDQTFASAKTLTLNLLLIAIIGGFEQYNQRELRYMQRAMMLGGWVTILLMFLLSDISVGDRLTLVIGNSSQDQNYINGFFLYTFSWHCNQLIQEKKKLHIIPVLFIIAVVLLTGSRGGLVAFILVLFVHVCISFTRTEHTIRNIILTALLIVVLFVAFDLILMQLPENIAERFSWDYIEEKGTTGRSRIWRLLLQHYSDDGFFRMLFGHGYGTSRFVDTATGNVAHNLYLDNLLTIGLIGLILQLTSQTAIIWILIRRRQYALLAAYFGIIGMYMSLSLLAYKPAWNIIILAFAIDFHEKSKPHAFKV